MAKGKESDGFSAEQIDLELSALLDTLAEESIPDSEKDHYQLISQTFATTRNQTAFLLSERWMRQPHF